MPRSRERKHAPACKIEFVSGFVKIFRPAMEEKATGEGS